MKKNKLKIILTKIFVCLLISLVFQNIWVFNLIDKTNQFKSSKKQADLYITEALTINYIYLLPIVKTFGLNSPIANPFYFMRDLFYKKAMSFLPKEDVEQYIWWYKIKFVDLYPYYTKSINTDKSQQIFFKNYLDDMYFNIIGLSKISLTNEQFKKERYCIFISTINLYLMDLMNLYTIKDKKLDKLYKDQKKIQEIKELYNSWVDLRSQVPRIEPEGLQYFQNSEINYGESLFLNLITQLILGNELNKNINSCDKDILKLNLNTVRNLLLYLDHTNNNLNNSKMHITNIKTRLNHNFELINKIPMSCRKNININEKEYSINDN